MAAGGSFSSRAGLDGSRAVLSTGTNWTGRGFGRFLARFLPRPGPKVDFSGATCAVLVFWLGAERAFLRLKRALAVGFDGVNASRPSAKCTLLWGRQVIIGVFCVPNCPKCVLCFGLPSYWHPHYGAL